jgi:hypothetical protein
VFDACRADEFESAIALLRGMKAARAEFLAEVQNEFDLQWRELYKMGASPLTIAWRTVLRRWPKPNAEGVGE